MTDDTIWDLLIRCVYNNSVLVRKDRRDYPYRLHCNFHSSNLIAEKLTKKRLDDFTIKLGKY